MDKILCPNTSLIEDYYKLTNSYIETKNKDAFALEIIKCNKDEKGEGFCASDEDIKEVVSSLVFTQYFIKEQIDFDGDNYGSRPTRVEAIFF